MARGAPRTARRTCVAGEDWHEGVIGIVASRLVERYHRPVVLIAGGDGDWKGSGRSIPSFDLHDGLRRVRRPPRALGRPRGCGGAVDPARERVEPFAEAFAAPSRTPSSASAICAPVTKVDAFVRAARS